MEDWWENWFSDLNMKGDNSFSQCQTKSYAKNGEHERQQPTLFKSSYNNSSNVVCWGSVPSLNIEEKASQGKKRSRSCWEARDHIMCERKRRQDMAEKFIALSALIPGLKKIDKASVLGEAINYVKQLKDRIAVLELEQESKRESATFMSIISIRKSQSHCHSIDCLESNKVLPEVEAISIETEKKEVLIRIHCEKQNDDILLKLLVLLENMHLSVASSSVLPFGKNTLNITIIAQMSEECSVTEEVLVKKLREDVLKLYDMHCNSIN